MDILIRSLQVLISFCVLDVQSTFLQSDLDYMARTLKIRARVLSNLEFEKKHRVCYYLTNTGSKPYKETDWVLFFNSFRSIEPDYLPLTGTVYLEDQHVNVTLIQGQFTAITPVLGFGMIQPNETRRLYFFNELWSVARYEFLPNWYLSSADDDLEPAIVDSTRNNDFVDPFNSIEQWKRDREDVYNPFTPEERYERNLVKESGGIVKPIIPTPHRLSISSQEWITLNKISCKIHADSSLSNEITLLQDATGCMHEPAETQTEDVIYLTTSSETSEDYSIQMNSSKRTVHIHGASTAGVFYGIQSFISILASYHDGRFPMIFVEDKPRFPYRGMHLDIARNFHGVEEVTGLIKAMAAYKLNKLHLHLSDDDGWRLAIKGLPELTEVGGRRCHDLQESKCISPQLGSGPFTNTSGSGHFTSSEYQTILRFAKRHHIEVIPEFDFPGHSHAAVRSMEARYHFYKAAGNESAGNEFRLEDPDDESKYLSIQEFNDNAINPCIESTYNFIEEIVKAVVDLHSEIQPLHIFHFGGDEVAKGAWVGSPACKRLQSINPQLNGPKAWKKHFVQRVSDITSRYNLSLGGWEDGFMSENNEPYSRNSLNNTEVVANAWDNVWEWEASMRAYRLANQGYKVIMSQATHLYFDHPAEPDPEERGLNWATRFTDTRKVFSFMPDNLYENIDTLLSGKKTSKYDICGRNMEKCDGLQKRQNIIGMQGQLWSEIVRTFEDLHYMIFPRLLALAERAWHKAEWETVVDTDIRKSLLHDDWMDFAYTLGHKELKRLDESGIKYRVPLPGARITERLIETNVAFPGLAVQYSTDTGKTWKPITSSLHLSRSPIHLRTLSADGKRHSRVVTLEVSSTNRGHLVLINTFIAMACHIFSMFLSHLFV